MKSIFSLIIYSVFLAAIFAVSVKAQIADEKFWNVLAQSKITGEWRINYGESDNPLLKMQTFLQNNLAQAANEKNATANDASAPTMSVSLVPPETLTLAGDDKQSITVNEGFSQTVFTRTFTTDGKMHTGELQNGTSFYLTATQTDNFLKLEIVSPRGNKMSETYTLAGEGKRLIVIVRFETAQAKEMLTLRRVYDRVIPDILTGDDGQIQ